VLERDYLRRGVLEFVGVFALVFVAAGGAAFARSPIDLALANGLVIAVMVSAAGPISGGHINPAVTLGFLVTRRIAPLLAVVYWIAQFGGAILAALLLKWVLPSGAESAANLGVPSLGSGIGSGPAVVVEAVLTFFLAWVVFATAVDPRGTFKQVAGLAIGFTIAFDVLMAYGLTGGAMNPARAFGDRRRRAGRRRSRSALARLPVGSCLDARGRRPRRRRPVDGPQDRPRSCRRFLHRLRTRLIVRSAAAKPELPGQVHGPLRDAVRRLLRGDALGGARVRTGVLRSPRERVAGAHSDRQRLAPGPDDDVLVGALPRPDHEG
jgi:aquaporin TIP